MFHYVAPVARGIANAYQDRLILGLRFLERFRPPGIPVNRIVGVLQQVGTRLVQQTIGVFWRTHRRDSFHAFSFLHGAG